jgi:maltose/moltooligosaccharide transporter
MIGVGIAWASILAMPYAILAGALPPGRMGVYMGIFNFFIVIPEIIASLALEPVVKELFGNDPVKVVMLGGASMLIAAICTQIVKEAPASEAQIQEVVKEEGMLPTATPPEMP